MVRKILLCLTLSLFTIVFANAQTGNLKGNIIDSDGLPLIGANVIIKGTTTGTITDIDGNYTLNLPVGEQIIVSSFIGYVPQERLVSIIENQTTSLNITLLEDVTNLEELIVIGYGVQKKADKTGAVTTVSAKDFNQGAITSAQELVTGKIAGVQITSSGGAPGSEAEIRVRGGSSLTASNKPLIIIDGVPIDNEDVSGMRNPLNTINPNDIETFTVLKDASATAIYGSRASNGVIIINTKSGAEGAMKVDYLGSVAINTVTKTVGVLDAKSYRETINANFPLNTSLMGEANTDWMDEIFSPSVNNSHNIAVSGKTGFLPFRISIGYDQNNGILETSKLDRLTTSVNLNPSFFDDLLKVKANVKYMHVENQFADEDAIGSAMTIDPTQIPYDMDLYPEYGGYFAWDKENADGTKEIIPVAPENPLAQLKQKSNIANVNRLIGNVQLDYKLHFFPEIRLNLNLGGDYSFSDGLETIDANGMFDSGASGYGGSVHNYQQEKRNEILEYYMQYDKELTQINSRFSLLGGYSWQHFWAQDENHTYYNEPENPEDLDPSPYKAEPKEYYLVSFFGRFNYSLADKYLLTGTLRYDGSSKFNPEQRWGVFPAFALAWKMNKENFLKNVAAISELKLRLGYGVTGQQDMNDDYYPALGVYSISQPNAGYQYRNPNTGLYEKIETLVYRPDEYDELIKWEETTTYNLGLDFGLYNDRITGSLEGYYRQTSALLSNVPVPAGSNFKNRVTTNVGDTDNKGVELSLMGHIISKADFNWRFGINGSYNDVKITKLTVVDDPGYSGVPVGNIEGGTGNDIQIHQVDETPNSFFVYEQIYDANGNPIEGEYADLDGDGNTNGDTDDLRIYHSSAPTVIFGINSNITYKKWDFSFAGHGSVGNYVYNNVASNTAYTDRLVTSGIFLSNITDDIYNTNFQRPQYLSDYYVQNASFFRLDNITLGYNFEPIKFKGIRFRVYAAANNVAVITSYEGIDPEVFDGIDNNNYPRPRTFLLGVNMSF